MLRALFKVAWHLRVNLAMLALTVFCLVGNIGGAGWLTAINIIGTIAQSVIIGFRLAVIFVIIVSAPLEKGNDNER